MRVVIAGAGPAGAATAWLLARCGVEVLLVERESSFERVFRGEALMPSGVEALREMGLGEVLASAPGRLIESWNIHIDRVERFVVPEPISELGERAARVVSQPALLEGIVAAASRLPSFRFERGVRVHDLVRGAEGRVSGLVLETPQGRREERADLVIGCDGRGSLLRTRAGLELELLPEEYDVLWFKVPAPDSLRERCPVLLLVAARRHPVIAYPSWDGRLQCGLIVPKGGASRVLESDWLEETTAVLPVWLAEHVRSQRESIGEPIRLNVMVGRCRSWTVPGLLLLGDAVHPMSPVRAQGINLALRDAIVAANHLVPVLRAGGEARAVDEAARAVQAEREPEVVRAQTLQHRETRGQKDARQETWLYKLARSLAGVGRYRWAQRAWLDSQRELRFGTREVRLKV